MNNSNSQEKVYMIIYDNNKNVFEIHDVSGGNLNMCNISQILHDIFFVKIVRHFPGKSTHNFDVLLSSPFRVLDHSLL